MFFAMALVCTTRSDCTRRQFGCVAVSPKKRIVATGYNGPPQNEFSSVQAYCFKNETPPDRLTFPCCKDKNEPANSAYDRCNALHAEMNCLNQIGTDNHHEWVDLYLAGRCGRTGAILDAGMPCILCSRMIKNFNVRYIHSLNADGTYKTFNRIELITTA